MRWRSAGRSNRHDVTAPMCGRVPPVCGIRRLPDLSNIPELTEVRRVLEVPAARHAAIHRTDAHIRQLDSIVERQRTTTIEDPAIPEYDLAFHTTIGQASGNRLLAAFIAAVHDATHPAQFLDVTEEVGRKTVKQHMAILAAIKDEDEEAAAKAMATHLDYVLRYSTTRPTD
ncbi:FCD domain-containing protein [Saccharomonospora sp. NPDC046836]|uniref:FadR/GntR family transcriptional regulator n=1 Tax=Saccharomonospora sp. NPDC046836 TaxID=3156921 RepID=UPI0033EE501E